MVEVDRIPEIARRLFGSGWGDAIVAGIGDDDCAVVRPPSTTTVLIVKTDLMNHEPALMTLGLRNKLFDYGYLAAAANLSDLYGSGARPLCMLMGLAVPKTMSEAQAEKVLRGFGACCGRYAVPIVGGDSKSGPRLQAYGVAVGWAESEAQLFLRRGMRPGQDLYLSGPIGDFNAAVAMIDAGRCPADLRRPALRAITRPALRDQLSLALSERHLATGGIDISDGLGLDLWRFAEASGVRLNLDKTLIPVGRLAVAAASVFTVDPLSFCFSTGGDWQFAFSADREHRAACVRLGAFRIGTVEQGEGCFLGSGPGTSVVKLPRFGHSDDRGLDFGQEIRLGVEGFTVESRSAEEGGV